MSMEMFYICSDSQMSLGYFCKQQSCLKSSTEINCNNHSSSVAADPMIKQQTHTKKNDNKTNVPGKCVLLGK